MKIYVLYHFLKIANDFMCCSFKFALDKVHRVHPHVLKKKKNILAFSLIGLETSWLSHLAVLCMPK